MANISDEKPDPHGHGDRLKPAETAELLNELQDKLTTWAKRRFWLIAVLISVTGVLGLYTIFEQTLRILLETPVTDQIQRMERQATAIQSQMTVQLGRFDDAYQKLLVQLSSLEAQRTLTVQAAEQARTSVVILQAAIDKSKSEITSLNDRVTDIAGQARASVDLISKTKSELDGHVDRLTRSADDVYSNAFESSADSSVDEIVAEIDVNHLSILTFWMTRSELFRRVSMTST